MNKILKRKELNPTVTLMVIEAPLIAKKAEPGQFVCLDVELSINSVKSLLKELSDFERAEFEELSKSVR